VVACLVRQAARGTRYAAVAERLTVTSDDPATVTRAIARALGDMVTRYPDQWFVFEPGWMTPDASGAGTPARSVPLACGNP
jgi:lauroyl/myristoyl acyltransferase